MASAPVPPSIPEFPEFAEDDPLLDALDAALDTTPAGATIAVAFSGGRDSTALLHAASRLAQEGEQVLALHVHHGLSPHADAWVRHAEAVCAGWAALPGRPRLLVQRLEGQPAAGESVEAWARTGRHAALQAMAVQAGAGVLLLAHHRRDQAETFLLQALRGGGVRGLASMPAAACRDGLWWRRPWLSLPREAIEAYVARHALSYIEDDSNADHRFARNRLRLQVWPALREAFASAESALDTSAAWMQQAAEVLDELAGTDLAAVRVAGGLDHARFAALTPARQTNLLRTWLQGELGRLPSAAMLQRLVAQLPGERPASWYLKGGALRRYRGVLSIDRIKPRLPGDDLPAERPLCIEGAGRYELPDWSGQLVVEAAQAGAASVPLGMLHRMTARPRAGGDSFQSAPGRLPRSLKKQFQAVSLPAWERDGPLLFADGQLVFVPGLGIDARAAAWPGEPRVTLRWERGGS